MQLKLPLTASSLQYNPAHIFINVKIIFCKDCIGASVSRAIQSSQPNEIVLLENLRFHDGEERNDQTFARLLSKNGDIYVNDAFSVSHRQHASVVGITKHLPAFAGLSLKRELHHLDKILKKPKKSPKNINKNK